MALRQYLRILGFCEHSFLYNKVGELSHEEFAAFMDPNNYSSQLVIVYILVLDFVMSRKAVDEASDVPKNIVQCRTGFDCRKSMTLIWIEKVVARLPSEYRPYAEAPIAFVRRLTTSFFTKDGAWKPFYLALPESESEQG